MKKNGNLGLIGIFGNIIAFNSISDQLNSLFQQLKVIKYEGFIPEKHQELLESIRDEVALRLLKNSALFIAELDEVKHHFSFWVLSNEDKLYSKNLNSCIDRNAQFILDFIDNSSGFGDFTGTKEDQHLLSLIMKYITKNSIKSPMISKLVLVSQGPNYLVYQFFEINIPGLYYTVRFNFVDGKYSDYELSNKALF